MTSGSRIFNSINTNESNEIDSITFGDNGKGKVKGLDKIVISNDLSISNVLLVESLNFNLLSVAQLCDLGFKCIFGVDDVEIISVDGSNVTPRCYASICIAIISMTFHIIHNHVW
jgi:hypothetical protein